MLPPLVIEIPDCRVGGYAVTKQQNGRPFFIEFVNAIINVALWFVTKKYRLTVWGFTLYQQYFSYLTATVHKSMFLDYFLTSPLS